jgi:hypothetical protein
MLYFSLYRDNPPNQSEPILAYYLAEKNKWVKFGFDRISGLWSGCDRPKIGFSIFLDTGP